MKKATESVWTDGKGDLLLRLRSDDRFFVAVAGATREQLAELGEAIADALKENAKVEEARA